MRKSKHYNRVFAPIAAIGVGTVVSLLVALGMGALMAFLVLGGTMTTDGTGWTIAAMHFVGTLVGTMIAWAISGKKNVLIPLLSSACYTLLLIGIHILLIEAPFAVSWITVFSLFAASAIVVAVHFVVGGKRKLCYKKY